MFGYQDAPFLAFFVFFYLSAKTVRSAAAVQTHLLNAGRMRWNIRQTGEQVHAQTWNKEGSESQVRAYVVTKSGETTFERKANKSESFGPACSAVLVVVAARVPLWIRSSPFLPFPALSCPFLLFLKRVCVYVRLMEQNWPSVLFAAMMMVFGDDHFSTNCPGRSSVFTSFLFRVQYERHSQRNLIFYFNSSFRCTLCETKL